MKRRLLAEPENTRGILKIDVAPAQRDGLGRWAHFKIWLRNTLRFVLPRNRHFKSELQEYAALGLDAGKAKLRGYEAQTAQMEVAVAEGLAKARSLQIEGTRGATLLEVDQELRSAEATKLREEAAMLRTKRHLMALKVLRDQGYSVTPIVSDGELTGLCFGKSRSDTDAAALLFHPAGPRKRD